MRALIKQFQKTYKMADAEESSTVIKNVISLSKLQVISYVLPLAVLPYLFQILGADKFGLIAFAQAFVQYFIILTDYGFNVSATKEISLYREDLQRVSRIHASVMTIKTGLILLSLVILTLMVSFVPKFKMDWIIYVLSFGAVVGNALFPQWYFQGTEKMKHIADFNILGAILYALLVFYFVRTPKDYLAVPIITSAVAIMIGIWSQYFVFRKFAMPWKMPSYKEISFQIQEGWNIFISVVAINTYTTTRIFAVGLLTSNSLTGYYSIAEKIANAVQTFPLYSFSQAIFPRLSKIFQKNKFKALEIMFEVQKTTVWVSLICLPVVFVLSDFLIQMICGDNFSAAVVSLRFLLISVFFVASNAFRVQFLLVCGKTRTYSKIHITMACIGLPLIILMIHAYSYVGAAIATAIIEAGTFTLTYFTLKRLKL